nr:MAG TPA: hypothetical protein [Bacteriophage sp.]
MEKLEKFVEQPELSIFEGVKVSKDTERSFKNDAVEQELKDLKLETIITEDGSNGINTYSRKTYLKINLNEGDILLFNEEKGFYLPTYPVSTIEDAISDINSLKNIK